MARAGDISDVGLLAAVQAAREQGAEHGHIIVIVHETDEHEVGEDLFGRNNSTSCTGLSDTPELDGLDVDKPETLIRAVAAHLSMMISATGVQGIHVITTEKGQG